MFKKKSTRIFSVFLSLAMLTILPRGIDTQSVAVQTAEVISSEDKISSDLMEIMQESKAEDKISVWIWFTDIDQEKVDEKVKEDTGLTADNIGIPFECVPDELVIALEEAFDETVDEAIINQISNRLLDYVEDTEVQRSQEMSRADTFVKARRTTARKAYMAQNSKIIKELNFSTDEIAFQSQLTPSSIANLTVEQIFDVAESVDVVSIDFYDDTIKLPPNTRDNEKAAMRSDIIQQITGLTGDGVNVLVNDHGWVRSDLGYYNWIDPTKVRNVVNGSLYQVTNTSILPPKNDSSTHPNLVTGTLQAFSKDVNVFSVGYGQYADVEWAILNCDIHLINGSINLGTKVNYSNDAPAKWFDALVSTHNVTLIASGGNSESWQASGWPNVISPSSSYNSIATGAYDFKTTPHIMRDYRYNPINSTTQVNYKPDMVIAAGSTSEASPMITGIVSMMIQLKPSLAANPELIKAIMMASCHRKVDPAIGTPQENMTDGLTQRQGAGAIDAYNAISIVLQGKYGINQINSGTTNIDIVESSINSNINVSMVWLRNNTYTSSNVNSTILGTLQELELEVLNNNSNLMGISTQKNTCKQMVYFPASSTNGHYTIRVTKESQNTTPVRYAYAWSTDNPIYTNNDGSYFNTPWISGIYYIKNKDTGKYLTLDPISRQLRQSDFSSASSQQWIFNITNNNTYKIDTVDTISSGFIVAPTSGSTAVNATSGNSGISISFNSGFNSYKLNSYMNNSLFLRVANNHNNTLASWSTINSNNEWTLEKIAYQEGDVNLDGIISRDDADMISQYLTTTIEFTDLQLYLADLNHDNIININDIIILMKYLTQTGS